MGSIVASIVLGESMRVNYACLFIVCEGCYTLCFGREIRLKTAKSTAEIIVYVEFSFFFSVATLTLDSTQWEMQ